VRAFFALGSNMGDRRENLEIALAGLRLLDPDLLLSGIYESAPVGGPPGQGDYLNCVVSLETSLGPRQLLEVAKGLEKKAGRVETVRNGPRPLDVDVLLVGDLVISEPDLVVPHPRMYERAFVLAPLEDLDSSKVPVSWRTELVRAGKWDGNLRQVGKVPRS
jgi:2-amino-4-hydroxy-6-hydroxymethyldihydropteridine diphosphokinase